MSNVSGVSPVSAIAAPVGEPTRHVIWQLPNEPRLHVTRGGTRRDGRAALSLLGGLSALALLLVTLTHWPRTTARAAVTIPPLHPASISHASIIASAAGANSAPSVYPGAINAPYGLRSSYRPLPGYETFSISSVRSSFIPANVPPAAPTAIGSPIVRYSY